MRKFLSVIVFACACAFGTGAFACTSDQIDYGSGCADTKFSVNTSSIDATGAFVFSLSPSGTFYVDCGENGTLSGTGASGKIISRTYTTKANYTCTACPANNYCTGGTYEFSASDDQGITACAVGRAAPMGMWEPQQCGLVLHIGDNVVYLRTTKKTEYAVHFDWDHDGVADFFANMTPLDVPMHAGNDKRFKIKVGDVPYSVYDDTVTLPAQ